VIKKRQEKKERKKEKRKNERKKEQQQWKNNYSLFKTNCSEKQKKKNITKQQKQCRVDRNTHNYLLQAGWKQLEMSGLRDRKYGSWPLT